MPLYRTTLYPLKELVTKNPQAVFAIQNSNVVEEMFGINCVGNLEDLKEQVGIDECGYEGTRQQTYYSWDGKREYDRFMIIGQREGFSSEKTFIISHIFCCGIWTGCLRCKHHVA